MSDEQPQNTASKPTSRRTFLKTGAKYTAGAVGGALAAGDLLINTPAVQRALVFQSKKDFTGKTLDDIQDPKHYGLQNITAETWSTKEGDTFLAWHSETLERVLN